MRFLIAEDEKLEREYLCSVLKRRYPTAIIDEAANGNEAYEYFTLNQYTLCILDIQMPYMNGLEVIEKIRKLDNEVPILISTAHTVFEYARKAIGLGVNEYLVKPYSAKTLNTVLDHFHIVEDNLMDQILTYLNQHYQKGVSLDELAEQFGFSRFTLSRMINEETHKSLSELISSIRIDKAKELLDKGYSVQNTAYETGFVDSSYFTKTFRKITGMTPSEYSTKNSEKNT